MNQRVIEILLYLVTLLRDNRPIEQKDVAALSEQGYTDQEIGLAFSWLASQPSEERDVPSNTGFRIFHDSEKKLFQQDAYGYLLQLKELGVLTPAQLETIINQASVAMFGPLTVEDVKVFTADLLQETQDSRFLGRGFDVSTSGTVH